VSTADAVQREIPCPCCGAIIPEVDFRPVQPRWVELVHLIDGARARGWTHDQIRYLESCLGLAWTKGFTRGELALRNVEDRIDHARGLCDEATCARCKAYRDQQTAEVGT
jgi:hypothetical protein